MKECCICKKPIENGGFLTTLNNEVFTHGVCFMELLPIPSSDLSLTREQKKAERKIIVDNITQNLIEEYEKGK